MHNAQSGLSESADSHLDQKKIVYNFNEKDTKSGETL